METLFSMLLPSPAVNIHHLQDEKVQNLYVDDILCSSIEGLYGNVPFQSAYCDITSSAATPFLEYFNHEIHHIMIQQRIHSVVTRSKNCCYRLGHCIQLDPCQKLDHCNTCKQSLCSASNRKMSVTQCEEKCACDQSTNLHRICKQHKIFIKDTQSSVNGHSWTVSFIDDAYFEFDINSEEDEEVNFLVDDMYFIDSMYVEGVEVDDMESIFYESEDNDDDSEFVYFEESLRSCESKNKNIKILTDSSLSQARTNNNSDDNSPKKRKVRFAEDSNLVETNYMVTWAYAYRKARRGSWVQEATNRAHFHRRIEEIGKILAPVLHHKLGRINNK